MCLKNRYIALGYRTISFMLGAITIVYDFGIFRGIFLKANLLYFTIISNLICTTLFLALIIKTLRDIHIHGKDGSSSISPHIKGGAIICILLTMIVYHFILIPYALRINPYQNLKISDIIFHYVIPFLTLFDWILFDEKKKFAWYDPILWIMLPYVYVVIVFIQAQYEIIDRIANHMNRYIYNFLDIGTIGVNAVVSNIFSLTISFIIVGYILYGADQIKI